MILWCFVVVPSEKKKYKLKAVEQWRGREGGFAPASPE